MRLDDLIAQLQEMRKTVGNVAVFYFPTLGSEWTQDGALRGPVDRVDIFEFGAGRVVYLSGGEPGRDEEKPC